MQNHFKAVSLSYKKAPLEIRELVSLSEEACKGLLHLLSDYTMATDVLVLSTCNRTEVYYSSEEDLSSDIIKLLGIQKNIANVADYSAYFNLLTQPEEAISHLFHVAMGLDAQVVGDMQIANQVKRAYQWSADENMAGPFLHRLMHTIFFTNKKVVQQTTFRDGAASVSYAAVELINELTADIVEPRVLVIGLGEIGTDVCRNLAKFERGSVRITNRSMEKAEELAHECGLQTTPFSEVGSAIAEADVVLCSIAADQPFITKALIEEQEILSHKFLIDLSVPRSIEASTEDIPGVLLYNVDEIESKASAALEKRKAAIPQVKEIIAESIEEFNDWSKEMMVSPTIHKLKNALEQIRQEEMTRYLKNLNSKEAKAVEMVSRSMMQKIMKLPVLQLKAACKRGEAETLIDVLNDLFNLENQNHPSEKE
ncbi:glutamyl-tRNA reductase [Nafulsella turpanensis]|uniref:glutamyl-tRNA reductase n=1 Tax=Nafulsella turpanensis TaxID=1265690 RepID=UPI00034BE5C5|nr:glutamyl-tRNA reductase [Nafulsella turpanensis]